jgi:phage tail tape-measure protein
MTVRTLLVAFGAAAFGALAPAAPAQIEDAASLASYQAHLAAAEKSLRLEESRELRRWLEGAPQARRGWEWRYLSAIADTSARSAPAPGGPIRIAVAPDGSRIATVEGALVRLRNWPALEPLGTIEGHADAITAPSSARTADAW